MQFVKYNHKYYISFTKEVFWKSFPRTCGQLNTFYLRWYIETDCGTLVRPTCPRMHCMWGSEAQGLHGPYPRLCCCWLSSVCPAFFGHFLRLEWSCLNIQDLSRAHKLGAHSFLAQNYVTVTSKNNLDSGNTLHFEAAYSDFLINKLALRNLLLQSTIFATTLIGLPLRR